LTDFSFLPDLPNKSKEFTIVACPWWTWKPDKSRHTWPSRLIPEFVVPGKYGQAIIDIEWCR
jgi:hypothetical protein